MDLTTLIAQNNPLTRIADDNIDSATRINSAGSIIGIITNVFIGASLAGTTAFLMIAAIKLMNSRGSDPRATKGAVDAITYAVVGVILSVISVTIRQVINNSIGVDPNITGNF